ncbi:MAG: helix-turn-helix domain-containing protein [Rhodobacteraceae bacterium]|nr:helix-turn-helix domain-containing protein [Paracoccaceae bacterium]
MASRNNVDRKGNRKGEGQYLLLPYFTLRHPAWRFLSGAALKLFLELCTRFNGGNNGKLILSHREAKKALGMGNSTIARAFEELQEKGFVKLIKKGHWYGRQANEWQITMHPIGDSKIPENDWMRWRPPEKTEVAPEMGPSDYFTTPPQEPCQL